MPEDAPRPAQAAIRTDLGAIFVSMEPSRRAWLITSLSPGGGEKMSKHSVSAGDVSGLLRRFAELRRKAAARTGRDFPIIVIQEAGLDGFWIHRVLQSEGIESHVIDAASIHPLSCSTSSAIWNVALCGQATCTAPPTGGTCWSRWSSAAS